MQEGEGGSGHLPPLFPPPSPLFYLSPPPTCRREKRWGSSSWSVGGTIGKTRRGGKLLLRSRTDDDGRLRLLHFPGRSRPSLTVLPPSHPVRGTRGDMQSEGERMDGDGIKGVRCGMLHNAPSRPSNMHGCFFPWRRRKNPLQF